VLFGQYQFVIACNAQAVNITTECDLNFPRTPEQLLRVDRTTGSALFDCLVSAAFLLHGYE
jgi:hypothetical protein